jgi:hypothetical protein
MPLSAQDLRGCCQFLRIHRRAALELSAMPSIRSEMVQQLPLNHPRFEQHSGDEMKDIKTKVIVATVAAAAVALFTFGAAEALAAMARTFCVLSTAVFAVASVFGLATRFHT